MRSHFKREIPFIPKRKFFLVISSVLVALSIVGLAVRGLVFGIEFSGGTEIDFYDTGGITIEQMRSALSEAGEGKATVQTSHSEGKNGFMVRSDIDNPVTATERAHRVGSALKLPDNSYRVTTIGPDWGSDITRSSALAFCVAVLLIVAYVSLRYEFKMSLVAIAALIHDLLITVGVYAWTQNAITPNVIAALLTIIGYSLYDTVVVFHRMNENAHIVKNDRHKTFFQIANFSINEVIIRTINTSITSLVPVVVMLVFGGSTLHDFAFAMTIGLILGSYSSFGVAAPLFAAWKTREAKWKRLEEKYGFGAEASGAVPRAHKE